MARAEGNEVSGGLSDGLADARMTHATSLTYGRSRTPKAAAIAGVLFALLLIVVFVLLRISVPADPREPGSWLRGNSDAVVGALIMAFAAQPKEFIDSATFHFAVPQRTAS